MVHEMNACTGARLETPQFDITGDSLINSSDIINIGTSDDPIYVAPTGVSYVGILHTPAILRMPDNKTEKKMFSASTGITESLFEVAERRGLSHWRELIK